MELVSSLPYHKNEKPPGQQILTGAAYNKICGAFVFSNVNHVFPQDCHFNSCQCLPIR